MKTSEDVVIDIMASHDFNVCQDVVRAYANSVASAVLAKACEGAPIEEQARLMNIKIVTP